MSVAGKVGQVAPLPVVQPPSIIVHWFLIAELHAFKLPAGPGADVQIAGAASGGWGHSTLAFVASKQSDPGVPGVRLPGVAIWHKTLFAQLSESGTHI